MSNSVSGSLVCRSATGFTCDQTRQIHDEIAGAGFFHDATENDEYDHISKNVELFTHFGSRCKNKTKRHTRRIDMVTNYRSSEEIINFYNSHIINDTEFSFARIIPAKPEVISNRGIIIHGCGCFGSPSLHEEEMVIVSCFILN